MNSHTQREIQKIDDRIGFALGRMLGEPVIPAEHVYLSLTNRCNLRCAMCDIVKHPSSKKDELSLHEIKDIISQIKSIGVRHLIFSGGEPFLREDLLEILSFAVQSGIEMVDVITNGTLLDEALAAELVALPLNHLTISLDGLWPTADRIRGEGSFDQALRGLDLIRRAKEGKHSLFPTLGINFTITAWNIDDILPMVDLARSKDCNIIVFQPVLFSNTRMKQKHKNELWPTEEGVKKLQGVVSRLLEVKESQKASCLIYTDEAILKALGAYFRGRRLGRAFQCFEGIKRIVVTCDGKVWSCEGVYGDLRREGLLKIWNSQKASRVRKRVKRCRQHCFQDCVYFPLDLEGDLKRFLSSFTAQERSIVAESVLKKIGLMAGSIQGSAVGFWKKFQATRWLKELENKIWKKAQ